MATIVDRFKGDDITLSITVGTDVNIDNLAELFVYIINERTRAISAKFSKAGALAVTGYTNGIDTLQNMDTLTTSGSTISSAIKTTTGAGDAGFSATPTLGTLADESQIQVRIVLDLSSGVAPTIFIGHTGSQTTPQSNEVTLVDGENIVFLRKEANGESWLVFRSDDADQTNYSATVEVAGDFIALTKVTTTNYTAAWLSGTTKDANAALYSVEGNVAETDADYESSKENTITLPVKIDLKTSVSKASSSG